MSDLPTRHLTDIMSGVLEEARVRPSAVYALTEYLHSAIQSAREFVAGKRSSLIVPLFHDSSGSGANHDYNVVAYLPYSTYVAAMERPSETFEIVYNANGATEEFTGEDIFDSVSEFISEQRAQSGFLEYVTSVMAVSGSEFASRVRALMPEVSDTTLEYYTSILDSVKDSASAIKAYFSDLTTDWTVHGSIEDGDLYLSLPKHDDYIGNKYTGAIGKAVGGVVDFGVSLLKNIFNLKAQFSAMWNYTKTLYSYFANDAFEAARTVYDVKSDRGYGVMDLPIFSVSWEDSTELQRAFEGLAERYPTLYACNDCMQKRSTGLSIFYRNVLLRSIEHLYSEMDMSAGRQVARVTEVIVPSSPFDICLRVGQSENGKKIFAVYVVSDAATWKQYTDESVQAEILGAFVRSMITIGNWFPVSIVAQSHTSGEDVLAGRISQFFSYSQQQVTENSLVDFIRWWAGPSTLYRAMNTDLNFGQVHAYVCSALMYMCAMSVGFLDMGDVNITSMALKYFTADAGYNGDPEWLNPIDEYGMNLDTTLLSTDVFRPYTRSNFLPDVLHYQPMQEQIDDVLHAVLIIAIVVAALYVTQKTITWRRNARMKLRLLTGAADSAAWAYAASPTSENLANYVEAYSSLRRQEIVMSLAGLATKATSTAAATGVSAVAAGVGHLTGLVSGSQPDTVTSRLDYITEKIGFAR